MSSIEKSPLSGREVHQSLPALINQEEVPEDEMVPGDQSSGGWSGRDEHKSSPLKAIWRKFQKPKLYLVTSLVVLQVVVRNTSPRRLN